MPNEPPPSLPCYQGNRLLRLGAGRLQRIIKEASAEKRFVRFAGIEIKKMQAEINAASTSLAHRNTLFKVIEGIERLLAELEEKQPDEELKVVAIYQFKVTLRGIEP